MTALKKLTPAPGFRFQKTDGLGNPKPGLKLANATEEIRSMLLACVAVFARHGLTPDYHPKGYVLVQLTDEAVRDPDAPAKTWAGMAWWFEGRMLVQVKTDHQATLTVLIHEYLHLCGYRSEWTVSTLTNRFKQEIGSIASILLHNYYRGAAYLAHAKPGMAYPEGERPKDYNDDQYAKVKVIWTEKHRCKRRTM